MEPLLCFCLLLFVTIGVCPLVSSAPSELKCSDNNVSITGGTFTLSDNYNEDSVLRYRCPQGYYPNPVRSRQCFRGKWDPAPTKRGSECRKITCPNPNVLNNGVVEPYKRLYYVNDTTTYRCHSDYTFRGSSERVCQVNGKWSGRTPICSRDSDHCPDPGTPPGASRTGHIFNIDDKVTYRCDNKLKLLGSKKRVCQDSGQWSGQEPECYADFTYDTPAEVAEAFGNTLKSTLAAHEEKDQQGKKIRLDQKGKLNIFIALDASDSIDEGHFEQAKEIIVNLMDKISYYEVSPNYEVIFFATEATRLVSIANYKRDNETKLFTIIRKVQNYKFDEKGQNSGTNIAKAFEAILESMKIEEISNKTAFFETRHVIIMFTDGIYNMGGNPVQKINEIKQLVYNGDETKRDEYLDIYVFGVGAKDEVQKEEINDWVTKRPRESHFFLLETMGDVQQTFDEIIDESTSVGLCGLYRNYKDENEQTSWRSYPWLVQISVTREDGPTSNCLGSLVTPSFVLTAAHCFKIEDEAERITLTTPVKRAINAKNIMLHPDYKPTSKASEGIAENYQYDVALIELEKGVEVDVNLRPICIPCTKETSGALRLTGKDVKCSQHKKELLSKDFIDAFFMSKKEKSYKKSNVQIKWGNKIDVCIEDAKQALSISDEKARQLITEHFLCTGGTEQQIDELSCKGDSGGGTFLEQSFRAFQVGIVSWGLKDPCKEGITDEELENTRDFHVDLFNPKVQEFLKLYLGDGQRGAPLTFLER